MQYSCKAVATHRNDATIKIKNSVIKFGTTAESENSLPNPAELFLGSLAACILKNVERFSGFMHFNYAKAEIILKAERLEKPPRMDKIVYELTLYGADNSLNTELLQKNIEKFGTIFNTVRTSCEIVGEITHISS